METQQADSVDLDTEVDRQSVTDADTFLIFENQRVALVFPPVFNIGRRIENNLVINDPRVSRYHAQIRLIKGHYILFDVGSSGGTFINGRRIEQSIVYSGDVVSLAGVQMIFQQDAPYPRPDLRETDKFSLKR